MKFLKTVIALALTLSIALVLPLQSMAAGGKYVSEVYVAYGKDYESAKRTLWDKGYTPVDGNLNFGGKTYALMGYKTTNNIRDSITDLAVMNMNGDYSVENYKTLLKKQKTDIAESLNEFMSVIQEYRSNYTAGKTKAICAHDILNNYTDDDTGMKMGDLLNSETLQDRVGIMKSIESENPDKLPDLVTILLQGNAQVIKSIEVLLSMAADTADNSWIDRFAETDYDTMLDTAAQERPELNTEAKQAQYLDNLYGSYALMLGEQTIRIRSKLLDYESMPIHIDTASAQDIADYFGDIDSSNEALVEEQAWISIGSVYESLKNYEGGNFAKGELLDFFLADNDPEDTESFIPMAAALSEGQRAGMLFVDLEGLLRYAFSDEESWTQVFEKFKSELGKLEDVSVYQNIDRDLYKDDGSVALTGAAQRANNTADGTTGSETEQSDSLSKITLLTYCATSVSAMLCGFFVYQRVKAVRVAAFDSSVNKWIEGNLKKIYNKQEFLKYKEFVKQRVVKSETVPFHYVDINFARTMVWISRVVIITTAALVIASTVLTILEYLRDENAEQLPIPKYLVDNYTDADGGSFALNYKAVESNREEYFGANYKVQTGNCADLLADEGYQWLALYACKNSKAGNPLTPKLVVKDSSQMPRGYTKALHIVGEKGALNLAGSAFRRYSKTELFDSLQDKMVYVFYTLSNDVKTYDESAGNMTATALSGGMIAIIGFGGLALGAVLGAVVTVLVKKKKVTA